MTSWIKVLTTLPRDKDILTLAREMGCNRHEALGIAVDWLCWLDDNSADGETGLRREDIDSILCHDGFCEALEAVGWAFVDERGNVVAVDFDRHNGASAKKRAETARKVQKHRASNQNVTKKGYKKVTKGLPEEEEEEDIKENGSTDPKEKDADALPAAVEAAMTPEPEPPARRGARPANADEVADYLNTLPLLKLTAGQRLEAATAFFDEMEAVGWVNKYGRNVWQWRAAARNYATQWAENRHGAPYRGDQAARPSRNTGTYNDRDHSEYDDI